MRNLVAGKDYRFSDHGTHDLKGFEEPARLFEVGWDDANLHDRRLVGVSGDGHELALFLWGRNRTLPSSGETGPNGLPVHPGATVRNAPGLRVSGAPHVVDAWNFGALARF